VTGNGNRNAMLHSCAPQLIYCKLYKTAALLQSYVRAAARNLKLLLYIFEATSGLKLKFEKSEVMMISVDDVKA
jgi:hypothetical protein